MPSLEKGLLKKVSILIIISVLCRPNLKLTRSYIISGMYFGTFCSKSKLFARSIRMPSFLCNKLKTDVLVSCTNPGLL